MIPKYPVPVNYKVPQSQIRYKYKKSESIKKKARYYATCYKNISKYKFHKVKSDVVIDSLDYFVNIIKKWDEKSKEINGWKSCYLTYKIVGDVLRGIRRKYGYISKIIQFSNVDEIYQIADVINKKIIPLNNLIFGLFVAIEEHSNYNDFYNLQQIFEVLAQGQVLYHIPHYKSRNDRRYQLPWESIEDPVIEYRKKYKIKREKNIKIRKNLAPKKKQSRIHDFFVGKRKLHSEDTVLDSDDDEILDILDELDNQRSQDDTTIINQKYPKQTTNNKRKLTSTTTIARKKRKLNENVMEYLQQIQNDDKLK